jgi:hypothetical protein
MAACVMRAALSLPAALAVAAVASADLMVVIGRGAVVALGRRRGACPVLCFALAMAGVCGEGRRGSGQHQQDAGTENHCVKHQVAKERRPGTHQSPVAVQMPTSTWI